jgi:hypothetical protein
MKMKGGGFVVGRTTLLEINTVFEVNVINQEAWWTIHTCSTKDNKKELHRAFY